EAARQLGVPEGTLSGRLTTARRLLAQRLTRHGLALSGGVLATVLSQSAVSAAVPPTLVVSTTQAVLGLAAGGAPTSVVSARVAALTEGALKTMLLSKLKVAILVLVLAGMAAIGIAYLAVPSAQAQAKAEASTRAEKTDRPAEAPPWKVRATLEGH